LVGVVVSLADAAFETRPRALGALYAFEQQQPSTAASKLDGLRKYYCHIPPSAQVYFEVHKDDEEEPQWLADQIEKLSCQR
jgi:pyrroloquinoline-quinone synthase